MRVIIYSICLLLFLTSCDFREKENKTEIWEKEILETEQDFAKMVKEEGLSKAFLFYADTNAVLMRNNKLFKGKGEISEVFKNQNRSVKSSLTWEPDFVEVSAPGDLAYTYVEYNYKTIDSTGKENVSKGVFHTVWKRQPDGSWKYVWD